MTFKDLLQRGFLRDDDESGVPGAESPEAPSEQQETVPAWVQNLQASFDSKLTAMEERFGAIEQRFKPAEAPQQAEGQTPFEKFTAATFEGDPAKVQEAFNEILANERKQAEERFNEFGGRVGQIVAPSLKTQIVQSVAGELNEHGQKAVLAFLKDATPSQMQQLAQNPQAMELLRDKAELAHLRAPKPTAVPASHAASNFSDNLTASDESEISQYLAAFGPLGATREMAVKHLQAKQVNN